MRWNNSIIATATVSIATLVCAIPVKQPALSAENKQTQSAGEANGCQDLREGLMALVRSRRELSEANEIIEGQENKQALQGILNKTGESVKETNTLIGKLQCSKGSNNQRSAP